MKKKIILFFILLIHSVAFSKTEIQIEIDENRLILDEMSLNINSLRNKIPDFIEYHEDVNYIINFYSIYDYIFNKINFKLLISEFDETNIETIILQNSENYEKLNFKHLIRRNKFLGNFINKDLWTYNSLNTNVNDLKNNFIQGDYYIFRKVFENKKLKSNLISIKIPDSKNLTNIFFRNNNLNRVLYPSWNKKIDDRIYFMFDNTEKTEFNELLIWYNTFPKIVNLPIEISYYKTTDTFVEEVNKEFLKIKNNLDNSNNSIDKTLFFDKNQIINIIKKSLNDFGFNILEQNKNTLKFNINKNINQIEKLLDKDFHNQKFTYIFKFKDNVSFEKFFEKIEIDQKTNSNYENKLKIIFTLFFYFFLILSIFTIKNKPLKKSILPIISMLIIYFYLLEIHLFPFVLAFIILFIHSTNFEFKFISNIKDNIFQIFFIFFTLIFFTIEIISIHLSLLVLNIITITFLYFVIMKYFIFKNNDK